MSAPAPSAAPAPTWQFFAAVGLIGLTAISLFLTLIFVPRPYTVIDHLRAIRYHDGTFRYFPIPLTASGFLQFKLVLLCLSGLSAALTFWLFQPAQLLRREWTALLHEWQTTSSVLLPWQRLTVAERRTALGLFGALLMIRLYYLLHYPLYGDELVTYLSFVREGPVAATSFYPIPNNHILYSLLCWLFSTISKNFYWTIRLPTFLIGTLGPVLTGLLLLRVTSFRVAAWAVLLLGFFPYALFQSVVGRGYFLLLTCGQLGFLATLALQRGPARPRLAWLLWVATSVVGLYTMPTYLLLFAALAAGLLLRGRRGLQVGPLVWAGAVVGGLTLLLYAPVLVVSGPGALFSNGYVAPGAGQVAGLTLWGFVARTEGQLLGLGPLALPFSLGLTVAALAAAQRWPPLRPARPLVWLAALVLWLPYALLAVRGVYPPARVLSYRVFFLLLLAAPLADALLRGGPRWLGRPALAVGLPVVLWAGALLVPFQRKAAPYQQLNARVQQVYSWLQARHAQAVVTTHPHYQLYLDFFGQTRPAADSPLQVDAERQHGRRYQYQLLDKDQPGSARPAAKPATENADVRVYRLR